MRRPAGRLALAISAAWLLGAGVLAVAQPSTASAASWQRVQLAGPGGKAFLLSASCPSSNLCVAVGTNNLIASSTNPTGGPAAWSYGYAGDGPWPETDNWPTEEISGKQIQAISCPSVSLCVAVTNQGNIYSTTNPTAPPSTWHVTSIDGSGANTHLFGVSCPSVTLCLAVSGKRADPGKIFSSSDPAGAAAWSSIEFGQPFEFRAISCGAVSQCVVVADDGRIVASNNPAGPASDWSIIGAPAGPGSLRTVSCVSKALCVSGNQAGNILTSTNPTAGASSWSATDGGGSVQITGSACPAIAACVLVDNNGDVLTSTDPTGGKEAWSFANIVPYTQAEGNALFGASCPSTHLCLVTGARGQIFTATDPFGAAALPTTQPRTPRRGRVPKRPRAKIATVRLPFRDQIAHHRGRVMIRFYARGGARGFVCSFDGGGFRRCHSPKRYHVEVGWHVFRVRAIGRTGLRGPVATERIRIYPVCKQFPARATDRICA